MALIEKPPMIALGKKIYTFGYGNRKNLDPLIAYCEEKGIDVLVDVRRSPRGWSTIWSKPYLEKQLPDKGIEYLPLAALGNTSGTEEWVPEDELDALKALRELSTLCEAKVVVLMCAELDPRQCHRVAIAKKLSKIVGIPTENLL
jgi:uncharacterized protein (DUF488 family)